MNIEIEENEELDRILEPHQVGQVTAVLGPDEQWWWWAYIRPGMTPEVQQAFGARVIEVTAQLGIPESTPAELGWFASEVPGRWFITLGVRSE